MTSCGDVQKTSSERSCHTSKNAAAAAAAWCDVPCRESLSRHKITCCGSDDRMSSGGSVVLLLLLMVVVLMVVGSMLLVNVAVSTE